MLRATKTVFLIAPIATFSYYWANDAKITNNRAVMQLLAGENSLQLEQVQVFFRHGARTPFKNPESILQFSNIGTVDWDEDVFMKRLPCTDIDCVINMDGGGHAKELIDRNCPFKLPGGCGSGQLTTAGQQQGFDLGKWLASEYVSKHGLISPIYDKNSIYIRSTDTSRTLLTAVSLVAGFYGKENLGETVVIQNKKMEEDDLVPNYSGCAKLTERFKRFWSTSTPANKEYLDTMNAQMGLPEGGTPFNYIEILDIIKCRKAHDLFVPQYLLDNQKQLTEHALELQRAILGFDNVEGVRISVGSPLETVCCRINESIEGTCKYKMLLYSTHDTLILSLLDALNIFEGEWPPFCANVVIELYRGDNGERFIRVLYNSNPVVIDTESNSEFVPVEKFMKLVEKYRVLDWNEDCGNHVKSTEKWTIA